MHHAIGWALVAIWLGGAPSDAEEPEIPPSRSGRVGVGSRRVRARRECNERQEISQNLGSGFFFTREEIRRTTAQQVTQLLQGVPGVRVTWTGTEGGQPSGRIV